MSNVGRQYCVLNIGQDNIEWTREFFNRVQRAGFKRSDSPGQCEIVVYGHRIEGIKLTANDLGQVRWWPKARLILILQPKTCSLAAIDAYRGGNRRILSIFPVSGILEALDEDLKWVCKQDSNITKNSGREIQCVGFKQLLSSILGHNEVSPTQAIVSLLEMKDLGKYSRFFNQLLTEFENGQACKLDLLLLLLTCDTAAVRHDRASKLDSPFGKSDEDLAKEWRCRRFLEFLTDLREALSATPVLENGQEGAVLILDDNPDEIRDASQAVAKHLLGSEKAIALFNPLIPLGAFDRQLVAFLTNYQTLPNSEARGSELENALAALRNQVQVAEFILVDQLFKNGGNGQNEFLGPRLIRGLRRWMLDDDQLSGRKFPEILALSKTDEAPRIQDALRAGARDYIVKSRLTRLPVILEQASRGTSDPHGALHRNFSHLYSLPNETIGLLRAVKLPRIPFHEEGTGSPTAEMLEWARLLERLPKPDLHVHAGSMMSREFLVLASLVMLSRHESKSDFSKQLSCLALFYHTMIDNREINLELKVQTGDFPFGIKDGSGNLSLTYTGGPNWMQYMAEAAIKELGQRLPPKPELTRDYKSFRAHLHAGLGIRDFVNPGAASEAIQQKNAVQLMVYLLQHARLIEELSTKELQLQCSWRADDLLRVYLLVLASRYSVHGENAAIYYENGDNPIDLLQPHFGKAGQNSTWSSVSHPAWKKLNESFSAPESIAKFRDRGWSLKGEPLPCIKVVLPWVESERADSRKIVFERDPIGYTLATGTRSSNLVEYLVGCEFSGAEHLRRPFLIHVFARQVVLDCIRRGVFYIELKASPDGYADEEFEYSAVVRCLAKAFSEAQEEALHLYDEACSTSLQLWADKTHRESRENTFVAILGQRYKRPQILQLIQCENRINSTSQSGAQRLPCKVSLVFVGKRHKPLREMILEAAGAAVMNSSGDRPLDSAAQLARREFSNCRVVGFDLAGPEDGYPPSEYAAEFGRLGRLHLPITVHAGENAGAQFIEDAILTLRARRIGHGLSVVEDLHLLARIRDERIAIELCPVCNHQTSQFHGPESYSETRLRGKYRPYPLEQLLRSGAYVTINTDNPLISDTDMIREYFQASWALSKDGMSLWEALQIMRMGIVCSFLKLREKRHMMELVGQYLLDLFSDPWQVAELRRLVGPKDSAIQESQG